MRISMYYYADIIVMLCRYLCCTLQGYRAPRAFIAAQSPMETTVDDFWILIAEKNVQTVLLLCQLVEDTQVRILMGSSNASKTFITMPLRDP